MKKLVRCVLALSLLVMACNKSNDSSPVTAGSWKIGSKTYTASSVAGNGSHGSFGLSASNGSGSITFTFNGAATPAAGNYKVVSATLPDAGQVSFIASPNGVTLYAPYDTNEVSAVVTVHSGKVGISLPDIRAKNTLSATDTVRISADIMQQ